MYRVEFTYETAKGQRDIFTAEFAEQQNWLELAQKLLLDLYVDERVRRVIVWDLSLPSRSTYEPVRVVDQSFPDCWAN